MRPSINPNSVTPPLDPGTCAVCHRADSVPENERDRIPAFCSKACKAGWLELWDITSPATHVVEDDQWVPVTPLGAAVAAGYERMEEIHAATQPATRHWNRGVVVPGHLPLEVDQVVAEAGPPITPITADELAACRRNTPAPRPVPGGWLRNILGGVFR